MTRKVSIFYHMFPHYRAPVLRALSQSSSFEYKFYGSHDEVHGIKGYAGDDEVVVRKLVCSTTKRGFSVSGMSRAIATDGADVVILLGNPNISQTWRAALVARVMGKKVMFWAHGWLRPEGRFKSLMRNVYFSLGHGVLVYSDRAKILAVASGYDGNKVFPIYNSLDWPVGSKLYSELEARAEAVVRSGLDVPVDRPLLICTARLTKICRFDLLLDAMSALKCDGMETTLVLVGDGPERAALEAQAISLQVDVRFLGAIYDEVQLAELLYSADVTVSPGKVGLTAMHSLTYGTPVVTHSDLDEQMPEVEAIIEGETGAFFRRGDVADLASAIRRVVNDPASRNLTRQRCRAVMNARYTPQRQRELIEQALEKVLEVSL